MAAIEVLCKSIDPSWNIIDGKAIQRTVKFKTFREAIQMVNRLADLAESEGHHPDMVISYRRLTIILCTYAIGGLSQNDFILARKIDELLTTHHATQ